MKTQSFLKTCAILLGCALLVGCANGYSAFYNDYTTKSAGYSMGLEPYSGATKYFTTNDAKKDGDALVQKGYVLLGVSDFMNRRGFSQTQLEEQATRVGADVVLYASKYLGSEQVQMPTLDYTPGQTYTTYTPQGMITTTSSGTYTSGTMNYSVHNFEHGASFWRMGKPKILGCFVENLPDEMRKSLQRNSGVIVKLVVDNSPAFKANILVDDVIISINGIDVISQADYMKNTTQFANTMCDIVLLRDGKQMKISVMTNPNPLLEDTAVEKPMPTTKASTVK